jgi:hypothetical protein
MLIDNAAKDIVAGYDRLLAAESALPPLLRARALREYARRRQAYDRALAHWRQENVRFEKWLLPAAGGLVLSLLLGLSAIIWGDRLEPGGILSFAGQALVTVSTAGVGLGGLIWLWRHVLGRPRPPRHPGGVRPLRLTPLLDAGLRGELPAQMPYEGAQGEYSFIALLSKSLPRGAYIAYRLQQQPGDDIDVTVVGPAGLWLFEVKYWAGEIVWHAGCWSRTKSHYGRGGMPVTEEIELSQPPDAQWQRMQQQARETLRRRAPELLSLLPEPLAGGLVFAHPGATLRIDRQAPFAYGTPAQWAAMLAGAPAIAGLDERSILRLLEALLERHHELNPGLPARSLDAYAARQLDQLCRQHFP